MSTAPEMGHETGNIIDQLRAVLPSRGRVYIVPHNYPDPDALASAAGIHLLLAKQFRLKGQILFTGTVSRAENRELLKQFRYSWVEMHQETPPSRVLPCVLVDTSPWSGNVTIPDFARPVGVIDHHPLRRRRKPFSDLFVDIREGAGATCTMVHEYLLACDIAIPKWLCTIMAYAIASETLDLSRDSTEADLSAYVRLLSQSNLSNLGRIRHAPLSRRYYSTLQEAMQNAKVYGRVSWTHLEAVEQPEIVAEVADLLHRLERITWAFCTAESDGRILVSVRSSDPHARCGRLLKKLIGKNGTAGGHHHMAAGYVVAEEAEARERQREALVRGLVCAIEKRSKRCLEEDEEPLPAQDLIENEP